MIWKLAIETGKRFALTLSLVILTAAPSSAADVYLVAGAFDQTMSDGRVVPMWGYAAADPGFTNVGPFTAPGPAITVLPPGDTTLNIHLRNDLPEATSIVIPGQTAILNPVHTGGRMTSFTGTTAGSGGENVYSFTVKPGTYLYHSGTHPAVQVQMGLYGMLKVDAATMVAYPGIPYDSEVEILYSEVDPELHDAIDDGSYGTTGPTSTIGYTPQYFLVNGEEFQSGQPALPAGVTNGKVLLRLANAGLTPHVPQLLGADMNIVAEDGNALTHAQKTYSTLLAAMKTKDAVWNLNPTPVGVYPLYDRFLDLQGAGATNAGLLTLLEVTNCVPCSPVVSVTADTWCRKKKQTKNYGDDEELKVDKDAPEFALLRVNVSGSDNELTSAMLHVKVDTSSGADSSSGGRIQPVPCTWDENTATWNNTVALLSTSTPVQEQGPVSKGQEIWFDISQWLVGQGDGDFCFAITSQSSNEVIFRSKESGSGGPYVTFDDDCDCPTGTTTTTSTPPSTVTVTTTPATTTTTTTLTCSPSLAILKDARTEEKKASTNYGNSAILSADADSEKNALFCIQLACVGSSNIGLTVKVASEADESSADSDSGGYIQRLVGDFNESTVTYNTAPAFTGTAGPDKGPVTFGNVVTFNLGALGSGMHCFGIRSHSGNGVDYYSTEAASGQPFLSILP
jgi:hypothetical protein